MLIPTNHDLTSATLSWRFQHLLKLRWVLTLLLASLLPSLAGERTRVALRVGYFSDYFVQDAQEGEERTPFEPWVQELKTHPLFGETKVLPVLPVDDFRNELRGPEPPWDVFPLYAYDYHMLKNRWNLEAILIPDWDQPLVEYSIYVAQTSRITKIADLREQSILFEATGRGELPLAWFDNQIRKNCQNLSWNEVCHVKEVRSAMLAALPLYFKEEGADACLLSSTGYKQVVSANPDIAGFLRPIAQAPKLLSHVIACRKDLSPEQRQHVINISLDLSSRNSPLSRGLHFSPFKPEYLEAVINEWEAYLYNRTSRESLETKVSQAKAKDFLEARAAAAGQRNPSRSAALNSKDTGNLLYPSPKAAP